MQPKDWITVCDVLDSGACLDGVLEWVEANGNVIAGDPQRYISNEHIAKAANLNGDGDGNGYGDGDGNGYGDGDGNGYGESENQQEE